MEQQVLVEETKKEAERAVFLQAHARGFLVRKKLCDIEEDDAAVMLQKIVRGKKAKARCEVLKGAADASKMLEAEETERRRKEEEEREKEKEKEKRKEKEAREEEKAQGESASVVQAHFRGHVIRKRLWEIEIEDGYSDESDEEGRDGGGGDNLDKTRY